MDNRAKNILFKTYWSSKGWKDEPAIAPDDFIYAKEKGLMFEPLTISYEGQQQVNMTGLLLNTGAGKMDKEIFWKIFVIQFQAWISFS